MITQILTDQAPREPTIDSRELVAILWKGRWLIAVSTVLFTAMLTVLAYRMTPIYRGSAVLVPASADRSAISSALGSVSGLAALAGINVPSRDSGVEEALAVLSSRQFTETFIARNNLLPELFHDFWDDRSARWKVGLDQQPTLNTAFRAFDRIRTVTRDTKTGLITLQVDWRDRVKATEWTNKLVEQLNEEMRGRAIADADASMVYLKRELVTTSEVSIRDAINRLIENQVKQRMLANVTQEFVLRFVDRAMAPDASDPVRPRKTLLMAVGMLLGLVVGIAGAFLVNVRTLLMSKRG